MAYKKSDVTKIKVLLIITMLLITGCIIFGLRIIANNCMMAAGL